MPGVPWRLHSDYLSKPVFLQSFKLCGQQLSNQIDQYLRSSLLDRQIVTMHNTRAKRYSQAQKWVDDRLNRLAQKYNVMLPKTAPERQIVSTAQDALYYVGLPQTMYGLENIKDGEQQFEVQAYAWPLQPKEWNLPYWTKQGFSIFILTDVAFHLDNRPSERISRFFEELLQSCQRLQTFEPVKPLHLEYKTLILDCS